jgi:zinc protease
MKFSYLLPLIFLLHTPVFAIPTIQHWETDNGARVYFVPAPELPMVDIEIVFDAGSARDGEQPGLATLTNDLLSEGAGEHSADEIAEHFDSLGAKISQTVDRDTATVRLRTLTDAELLQSALDMFALLVAKPTFEATAFNRTQQQTLTYLKYQQQLPSSTAEKAFYQAVFGDHPYAHLSEGTPASVASLTPEAAKAFHARYYVAKNAIVAIVGAVERKQAEQLAQKVVHLLPIGQPAPQLPSVASLTEAKTIHLDHPSTQTHILIGQPGVARGDPDYFTLYVGNYIFGGSGLVSRLSQAIREEQGLAYSVQSYFYPQRMAGAFEISLETGNEQTQRALQIINTLLHEFIKTGPTAEELKQAKQGITGRFPLRIKSNKNIIGYLSTIGFYQLPLDYLHTFNDKIEAVSLEMITDAFNRRIQLDKLVTITVGG